ncbi:hypothetical protein ACSMFR_03520 [Listeria aquatica]|uniref:Crp/Fnr family transcriptional regulator n=2 Tax=Listeria aquatica TaxID=1494960 RepID=A0A841ZM94_9LIST|nr:hypothetical protein [Listeria aquatica]MBC1521263.1 hypothetical protein [Listeria aquatica]
MDFITFFKDEALCTSDVRHNHFTYKDVLFEYSSLKKNEDIGILLSGDAVMEIRNSKGVWVPNKIIKSEDIFGIENFATDIRKNRLADYRITGLDGGNLLLFNREYLLIHMSTQPEILQFILDKTANALVDITYIHRYSQSSLAYKLLFEISRLMTDLNLPTNENIVTFPKYITITFLAGYLRSSRNRILEEIIKLENQEVVISRKPLVVDLQKVKQVCRARQYE